MKMFVEGHPDQKNCDSFYDAMTGKAYDDFLDLVNFTDPNNIRDAIAKPNSEEFGWLNASRHSNVFDIGHGSGIMGKLMNEQGFTNIDGADASQKFVSFAQNTGWY